MNEKLPMRTKISMVRYTCTYMYMYIHLCCIHAYGYMYMYRFLMNNTYMYTVHYNKYMYKDVYTCIYMYMYVHVIYMYIPDSTVL